MDARARPLLRLAPPALGPAGRAQAGAVALGALPGALPKALADAGADPTSPGSGRGGTKPVFTPLAYAALANPIHELSPGARFDVVVIGSGYGGAITAARLAERLPDDRTICVLERGKEWAPGSFPTTLGAGIP